MLTVGVHFAINMLSEAQTSLASCFANASNNKFEQTPYRLSDRGIPLVADSVGYIECELVNKHRAGDHAILIGQAMQWCAHEAAAPLIVYRGSYLAAAQAAARN